MMRAVVVGSGAGGATAARQLQGAFDVTVLEAGHEFHPFKQDLSLVERLRSSRLFLDERMIRLLFPPMHVTKVADHMSLVYGVATGGTTTLATGNALRCDEALLDLGIDLSPEFAALEAELPISTAHQARWRDPTKRLFAACCRPRARASRDAQAGGLRALLPLRAMRARLSFWSQVGQPPFRGSGGSCRGPAGDRGQG